MSLYSLINFLHVVGSIGMIVAISIERLILMKLLKAKEAEPFLQWKGMRSLPMKIGAPSMAVTLVTGLYLAFTAWPSAPWIWPSIIALVLIAATGAFLTGTSQKVVNGSLSVREIGPTWGKLWLSLQIRTGLLLGILFLMVTRPSSVASIVSLLLFTLVFTAPVAFFWRKYRPLRENRV